MTTAWSYRKILINNWWDSSNIYQWKKTHHLIHISFIRPENCQSCQQPPFCGYILHILQVSRKIIRMNERNKNSHFEFWNVSSKHHRGNHCSLHYETSSLISLIPDLSFSSFILFMMMCQTKIKWRKFHTLPLKNIWERYGV